MQGAIHAYLCCDCEGFLEVGFRMNTAHIRAAMQSHGIIDSVIDSVFQVAQELSYAALYEGLKGGALLVKDKKSNGLPYATNSNAVRQQRFKRKKREKSVAFTLETAKNLKLAKV